MPTGTSARDENVKMPDATWTVDGEIRVVKVPVIGTVGKPPPRDPAPALSDYVRDFSPFDGTEPVTDGASWERMVRQLADAQHANNGPFLASRRVDHEQPFPAQASQPANTNLRLGARPFMQPVV